MEITRIVKLTLHQEHIADFEVFFDQHKATIAASEGCLGVELYREESEKHIFFTISQWEKEADLEKYRHSPFFIKIWPQVKQWLAARTEVHTLKKCD